MQKVVVVGGVAAGMSAAAAAKRQDPQAEVIVLERGRHISYGSCGIPYNIGDPERRLEDLVVVDVAKARDEKHLDVRVENEVLSIDTQRQRLHVQDIAHTRRYDLDYDRLVIATGALAARPTIPGLDQQGVYAVRDMNDAQVIKRELFQHKPRRAVIIGSGYIGLEMAEVFRTLGLEVTILEKQNQILPGFEPDIADEVSKNLGRHGVKIATDVQVRGIDRANHSVRFYVQTDRGAHLADIVIVAVGIRPNVELAAASGIKLGNTGALFVDKQQRTNVKNVYAAGDCCEVWHRLLRAPVWMPLGTTANKQGKVAGRNAAGKEVEFAGIVGTAGFKLFDWQVARTGLGSADVRRHHIDAVVVRSQHQSRGHAYPGGGVITTVLLVERASRRLLGAQMVGPDNVAGRVNVYATALSAGWTVDELEELDLAYAPPFSPVYDPILIAASTAKKKLEEP